VVQSPLFVVELKNISPRRCFVFAVLNSRQIIVWKILKEQCMHWRRTSSQLTAFGYLRKVFLIEKF
jgi:hypothetical protein